MSPSEDAALQLVTVHRHLRSLAMTTDPAFPQEDWGFLAQQALEKVLKASIVLQDQEPPLTHELAPRADGNGCLGRLWQTLILSRWNPLLAWLPIEEVMRSRQQGHYNSLGQADQRGDLEPFVAYQLEAIHDALHTETSSARASGGAGGCRPHRRFPGLRAWRLHSTARLMACFMGRPASP